MRLSALQRYILRECYGNRKTRILRTTFSKYYRNVRPKDAVDSITKSLERLIEKGLLIGYGRRTPKKWFIEEVQLTTTGRQVAKQLFGQQQTLPFRKLKIEKR